MAKTYTLLSGETVLLKELSKSGRDAIKKMQTLIAADPEGDEKGNFFELLKIVIRYPRDGLRGRVLEDVARRAGIAQNVIPAPEHEQAVRKANFGFSVIPFVTATEHSMLKFSVLRKLLEDGTIEGRKVGNVWFVILSSLEDYMNLHLAN